MSVCLPFVWWYPWRPEVGIRFTKAGITDNCEPPSLHTGLQTWIFWNKRKCSCLLNHLSTHSLYTWVDGNIIHNSQRSKQPKSSFTGKWKNKMWPIMWQNITQPRVERHCMPEARYLNEAGWSPGATIWMKLKDIVLSETHKLWDKYRIPLYEIGRVVQLVE